MSNNIPIFTMLVGLPGSGKSTYAKKLTEETNAVHLNPDTIRKEMTGSEECFDKDKEVFEYIAKTAKETLKAGVDVIYDATNLSSKKRAAFLAGLGKVECVKQCVIVATPYAVCLNNNQARERHVPEKVIEEMYRSVVIPYFFEGWDDIMIHYNKPEYETLHGYPENFAAEYMNYSQDNFHHAETLGEHSLWVQNSVVKMGYSPISSLGIAAAIHDCGKPFTKSFTDIKGNPTKDAHYYGHHCVGGYEALFFDIPRSQKLEVATYVSYHMEPYFWKEERTKAKKEKQWGTAFFNAIMDLNKADEVSRALEEPLIVRSAQGAGRSEIADTKVANEQCTVRNELPDLEMNEVDADFEK